MEIDILKQRSGVPGSSFYKSVYMGRDKTIKEFYDSGDEHSFLTERELSFQNIGLNYNYFHLINQPLKNKKLQRLYGNQPCALFVISKTDDNLSEFIKAIQEFAEQKFCCFVYLKKGMAAKKCSKIFSSNENVVFLYSLNKKEWLPLIQKVDYVVLNEYEDCIDAVLMEKKTVLVQKFSNTIMKWETERPDSKRLRGICLYFFLVPLLASETHININRVSNINMLLQYVNITPDNNCSGSGRWYRFKKRLLKFKRDPKRFFLDSRFPVFRHVGHLF